MIKLVIFDADGPLYHRGQSVSELKAQLLSKYDCGGKLSKFEEIYEKEKFTGYSGSVSPSAMFQNILAKLGASLDDEQSLRFAEEFDYIQSQIVAQPNAVQVLTQLHQSGYKTCVLTDSFYPASEKWVWFETLGIATNLDHIVSSCDIKHLKDTPEAYGACLDHFGVSATEAVFVGHQEYEMAGARSAHIASIAVIPIAPPEIHSDFKVQSLTELPELLERIEA